MDRELSARWPRFLVVMVAAVCAVAVMAVTGIPGNGMFLVFAGGAGIVAALALPRWYGYVLLVGALAVATVLGALALGWYTALLALVIASLVVPATAGWLAGYAIDRTRHIGSRAAVLDLRILGALAGIAAILALIWFIAMSFATNPP